MGFNSGFKGLMTWCSFVKDVFVLLCRWHHSEGIWEEAHPSSRPLRAQTGARYDSCISVRLCHI